jgi:deazaflavin-dependent oxidoreductase (nitroreductase family)
LSETRRFALEAAMLGANQNGPSRVRAVSVTSTFLRLQQWVYIRTDGRLGHGMSGVSTLLLRTTGRRSGATRTNGLVYARDGDSYLVVASNGGSDRAPAWLHNLWANPEVGIQVRRERLTCTARVIEPSDRDHERFWRAVNDNNRDRYTAYQQKTARPIPVIELKPS